MFSRAPAALLGFLAVSGAVIGIFPFRQAWIFYQWTTLSHVLAGLLVLPALVLVLIHARSLREKPGRKSGVTLLIMVMGAVITGALELVLGQKHFVHALFGFVLFVPLGWHAWRRPTIRLPIVGGFLALALLGPASAVAPISFQRKRLPAGVYKTAAECGKCHKEIYAQWKRSSHGRAYLGRAFFSSLSRAESAHSMTLDVETVGKEPGFVDPCLRCHAPTRYFAQDKTPLADAAPSTQDGVGCPFCHTVEDVRPTLATGTFAERMPEYVVRPTRIRPYLLADHWLGQQLLRLRPEVHREDIFRPIMRKSEFCMPCHGLGDMLPHAPESTYQDWQASDYKNTKRCQDCHMGPRIQGRPDHRFLGGNLSMPREYGDADQLAAQLALLKDAVSMSVVAARLDENSLIVDVQLENRHVGHNAPGRSQMDSRYFWLRARALGTNGQVQGEIADPTREDLRRLEPGVLGLVPDEQHFLPKADTTLRAGEKRLVQLRIPILSDANPNTVEVELRYAGMLADWRDTSAVTLTTELLQPAKAAPTQAHGPGHVPD